MAAATKKTTQQARSGAKTTKPAPPQPKPQQIDLTEMAANLDKLTKAVGQIAKASQPVTPRKPAVVAHYDEILASLKPIDLDNIPALKPLGRA